MRFRQGYVADLPSADQTYEARLSGALSEGQPRSGLQMRAFAAPIARVGKVVTAIVTVDVSYPKTTDRALRTDDDLDLEMLGLDPDGRILASQKRSLHLKLPPERVDEFACTIDDALDMPKGVRSLRLGALSHSLATVGTVHMPLVASEIGSAKVAATPLVIGVIGGPRNMVARPEAIAVLSPFQPTTRRALTRNEEIGVFVRVFA